MIDPSTPRNGCDEPASSPCASSRTSSISVVVAAYTLDRWVQLADCMSSLLCQSVAPNEIVLCVDNNADLFTRSVAQWGSIPSVHVIQNPDTGHVLHLSAHERAHGTRRRFGAGSARNAGVRCTTGDIVAIVDDDAVPEATWLGALLSAYAGGVVAVGGPPLPNFETRRPGWFPRSFDWVFGCQYEGLPTTRAPERHLIGANMSFRRSAFDEVGGFQSIDFDDLDLCMRLGHAFGYGSLIFEPAARVHHFVPAERVTWRYFWRRCMHVNQEKVEAFHGMAEAANLNAEVLYGLRTATVSVARELRRVLRGDLDGFRAAAAIYVGLTLAVVGNVRGRWRVAKRAL